MKLIQLDIVGLSNSQTQSGAFALILGEVTGNRRLPIVIGNFEAKAIAIALDNEYKSQRPITHDLFKTFAIGFKIGFVLVIVNPNVDEESIKSLGIIGALIGSKLLVKKGIDHSQIFAKNKLNSKSLNKFLWKNKIRIFLREFIFYFLN